MALSDVYPAYRQCIDLVCGTQEEVVAKSDVIFAALPHGLSQDLAAQCDSLGKAFIDMAADFRLESEEAYQAWYGGTFADKALHQKAVYGLPEFFREEIKGKKLIANPGCYTTDGAPGPGPSFAKRPHRNGRHHRRLQVRRHRGRAQAHPEQPLPPSSTRASPPIRWQTTATPPRSSRPSPKMTGEGVKVTLRAPPAAHQPGHPGHLLRQAQTRRHQGPAAAGYQAQYGRGVLPPPAAGGPGGQREERPVTLNFCDISLFTDQRTGTFIAISAIDNMVKGAAGQAIQNMNLSFGLPETAGLDLVPPRRFKPCAAWEKRTIRSSTRKWAAV